MKLAITIFRYFPYGGLQRDMRFIAEEAIKRGHQVTIFCGDWQGEKIPDADIRICDEFSWFNIAGVRRFVKAFEKQFDRKQFDLLLGFNKMPGLDIYFAGDTCFAEKTWLDRNLLYRLSPRTRLYLQYEKSVLGDGGAKKILTLVPQQNKSIARWYSTLPDRVSLLPPGISKSHLYCAGPQSAKQNLLNDLSIAVDKKIILCLGSGFRTKGVDISIDSFFHLQKNYPHAVLLIAGGDKTDSYRQQAEKLAIADKVKFVGNQYPVANLLYAADLLLHPARYELAGNVILEAMLCDCPVLVSEQSGFAYQVTQHSMGLQISDLQDYSAIAEKIQHLLEIPKENWQSRAQALWQENWFSRAEIAVDKLEQLLQNSSSSTISLKSHNTHIILKDEWQQLANKQNIEKLFDEIFQQSGHMVRNMKDRQTLKIQFQDQAYYLKRHLGVGWWEIFKNLLQLRLPVTGASNEWAALQKMTALGLPSLEAVAYGVQGKNPAYQKSFIVTRELPSVVQTDHFLQQHSLSAKQRFVLTKRIAQLARAFHLAGINHRDFYLCHFMLKDAMEGNADWDVYIIDLHRAQIRSKVPKRWLVKDLAALYFSSMSLPISKKDRLRFLKIYFNRPLPEIFQQYKELLSAVYNRAKRLYRKHG